MKTYTVSVKRLRIFEAFLPLAAELCRAHKFGEFVLSTTDAVLLLNAGVSLSFLRGFPCNECTLRKEGRVLQAKIDDFKQRQHEQRLVAVLSQSFITTLCETPPQPSSLLLLQ